MDLSRLSREQLESEVRKLRTLVQAESSCRKDRIMARLARNTRNFWLPAAVPRRPAREVSTLEFVRDFVAASQPLVFTELSEDEWPCLRRWRDDAYLLQAIGDVEVSVNVTPDGFGDFVDAQGRFVKPCEERIEFKKFWSWLKKEDGSEHRHGVPYLSRQNDSLREEMSQLTADLPQGVNIGLEAFGNEPEAVNLWIGDERAVSSCHKDHYENLYIVVRGEKTFTLFPPAAVAFLHETRCTPATYERRGEVVDEHFTAVLDNALELESAVATRTSSLVPWIPFDVADECDRTRYPDFAQHGRRLGVDVKVGPGDMLYLPAMWYHRVAQNGLTVAVNYWHDMQFGHGYVHNLFVRDVSGLDDDIDDECEEE